jgi:hypothetical protein
MPTQCPFSSSEVLKFGKAPACFFSSKRTHAGTSFYRWSGIHVSPGDLLDSSQASFLVQEVCRDQPKGWGKNQQQ